MDWNKGHSKECEELLQEGPPAEDRRAITYPSHPPRPLEGKRQRFQPVVRERRFGNDVLFPEYEIVTEQEEEALTRKAESLQAKLDLSQGRYLPSTDPEQRANEPHPDEDEGEDEESLRERTETQMQILESYRRKLREVKGEEFDEETFEEDNQVDSNFMLFQEITESAPQQCLRYSFANHPLWVHSQGKPTHIPLCGTCGATRVFEFQVGASPSLPRLTPSA